MIDRGRLAPLRVAIVGLGPKGLFALERLLDRAAARPCDRGIELVAFEPHHAPGAGPVYDPSQPGYLRMNFAADQVDAWPACSRAATAERRLSFEAWRGQRPGLGDDAYPARGDVGRYLCECLQAAIEPAPAEISVTMEPVRVAAVEPCERGWRLRFGADSASFDEVLVATGHADEWEGALRHGWSHAAPLIDSVFPVERKLTLGSVPPGARVAARGFALTFIDMALALTEGRGGVFESEGPGLRYRPAGAEPEVILPFSRTGRPMLAKPEPRTVSREWERAGRRVREEILGAPGPNLPASLRGFVDLLAAHPHNPGSGAEAAAGAAWRAIYAAIVERCGGDGLDAAEWPAFRALAAEMERVAFGPPPLNARKLRALIEAGIVDCGHAEGGRIETANGRSILRSAAGVTPVDVVADAVLAPPGVVGVANPVIEALLVGGQARVLPGRRGIEVAADASCVGADGSPSLGLAACGRPTEDSVIGNDTLSRELHPQLDRWADRVIARVSVPLAVG